MEVIFLDTYKPTGENHAICLGSFDGIHKGHKKLMEKTVSLAKEKGIKSAVVTFMQTPQKNKVFLMEENLKRIEATGIDKVFIIKFNDEFKKLSPEDFVNNYLVGIFLAKYVVCGFNFRFGFNREGNTDTLLKLGKEHFELIVVDKVTCDGETVSSSYIKKLLASGNIERVNTLLGDCYEISDAVHKGKQLGRSIEIPTVNQTLSPSLCEIKKGVYSSVTEIDGKIYKSISYIGYAPTVNEVGDVILETHILDFKGDLYNKHIRVRLIGFIREEKKFASLEELKDEIELNINTAKKQISECEYI